MDRAETRQPVGAAIEPTKARDRSDSMLMIDRRAALTTVKRNATDVRPWHFRFHIPSDVPTGTACPFAADADAGAAALP